MSIEVKYPLTLAAVKKSENAQWAIGDALVAEVRGDRFQSVSDELKANGFEYATVWLSAMRRIAKKFAREDRNPKLGFKVHEVAGSPKLLNAIIAAAEAKGVACSKRFAEAYMSSLESDEDRAFRRKHEAAKAEQEDAEAERAAARKAKDERREREAEERETKAKQKVQETRPAPGASRKPRSEREPHVDSLAQIKSEFDVRLTQIVGLTRNMKRDIRPHVDELSKAWVEGTSEQLLEAANNLIRLADLIRKNQPNARGHLSVVA